MDDCLASNHPLIKRCRVCGDKALGFNFNGLSCESCKAFFRRNALRHEEYSCSRKGDCKIDRSTRKNCQYCRLNKCFAIGMRKELIYTTKEEKTTEDCKKEQRKRFNVSPPLKENISSVPDSQLTPLRAYESRCIEEIQTASAVFFDQVPVRSVGMTKSLCDIVNFSGWYPRRIISFVKQLASFRNLDSNDQLVIIKESFHDVMITLTAFNYNSKNDSFQLVLGELGEEITEVKLCSLYENKTKNNIRIYRRFVHQFQREMEGDLVIRNLIVLILVFSPKSPTNCQQYIRYYFFFYCHLMRRYFEQKYNSAIKPSEKFDRMMKLLDRLIIQKSTIVESFTKLDSSKITQLMAEILNIM